MEKKLDLFDLYEVFYVDVHLVDKEMFQIVINMLYCWSL